MEHVKSSYFLSLRFSTRIGRAWVHVKNAFYHATAPIRFAHTFFTHPHTKSILHGFLKNLDTHTVGRIAKMNEYLDHQTSIRLSMRGNTVGETLYFMSEDLAINDYRHNYHRKLSNRNHNLHGRTYYRYGAANNGNPPRMNGRKKNWYGLDDPSAEIDTGDFESLWVLGEVMYADVTHQNNKYNATGCLAEGNEESH